MLTYRDKKITIHELTSKTYDICHTTYDRANGGFNEFHHVDFVGGYFSVFGDMVHIVCDICQRCLKSMIEDHCYCETDDGLKKFEY